MLFYNKLCHIVVGAFIVKETTFALLLSASSQPASLCGAHAGITWYMDRGFTWVKGPMWDRPINHSSTTVSSFAHCEFTHAQHYCPVRCGAHMGSTSGQIRSPGVTHLGPSGNISTDGHIVGHLWILHELDTVKPNYVGKEETDRRTHFYKHWVLRRTILTLVAKY